MSDRSRARRTARGRRAAARRRVRRLRGSIRRCASRASSSAASMRRWSAARHSGWSACPLVPACRLDGDRVVRRLAARRHRCRDRALEFAHRPQPRRDSARGGRVRSPRGARPDAPRRVHADRSHARPRRRVLYRLRGRRAAAEIVGASRRRGCPNARRTCSRPARRTRTPASWSCSRRRGGSRRSRHARRTDRAQVRRHRGHRTARSRSSTASRPHPACASCSRRSASTPRAAPDGLYVCSFCGGRAVRALDAERRGRHGLVDRTRSSRATSCT